MYSSFKRIIPYFEFLKTNVKKDFRGKYKKSVLGVLWSFINPLLQIIIYSLVFPFLLRSKSENYVVFLILGIIPWTFFASSLQQSSSIIIANANIIKKIYFPREILPLSMIISNAVNFFISNFIIIMFLIFYKIPITINYLYIFLIYLLLVILLYSLSLIISSMTVYIRDLEHFISIFIMLFFYLTPIVYDISMIPIKYRGIFSLNPMTYIIGLLRGIVLENKAPEISLLLVSFIVSFIFLETSIRIFDYFQRKFAEEL